MYGHFGEGLHHDEESYCNEEEAEDEGEGTAARKCGTGADEEASSDVGANGNHLGGELGEIYGEGGGYGEYGGEYLDMSRLQLPL